MSSKEPSGARPQLGVGTPARSALDPQGVPTLDERQDSTSVLKDLGNATLVSLLCHVVTRPPGGMSISSHIENDRCLGLRHGAVG